MCNMDFGICYGVCNMVSHADASAKLIHARMSGSYSIFKNEVFYSKYEGCSK